MKKTATAKRVGVPFKSVAGGYVRASITVPSRLKRQMERRPQVNWSAVACQAFEAALAKLRSSDAT